MQNKEHWNSIMQDDRMKIQKNYRNIIDKVVKSDNNVLSNRAPKIDDIINALPFEILHDDALIDEKEKVLMKWKSIHEMEKVLRDRRIKHYIMNIKKKLISKKPKFKKRDIVRYYLRKERFSKESMLRGSWSRAMYKIHQINNAQKFKLMHTYILSKLGKDLPVKHLVPIQENLLKLAKHNEKDLFEIEKTICSNKGKVLVKWKDYEVPAWEPKSLLKRS